MVEKDKNLEQKLKKLEENLNELKLMAESNFHAINDTLTPDVIENSKKSEDIQREVDENHDNILELKMNGNLKSSLALEIFVIQRSKYINNDQIEEYYYLQASLDLGPMKNFPLAKIKRPGAKWQTAV